MSDGADASSGQPATRRERIALFTIADEAAYHEARVLILISAFTRRTRGLGDVERLVPLDYILRFPWVLENLPLKPRRTWAAGLEASERVVEAFDSRYAAARYGPWYDRYERMIAVLQGRGLVATGEPRDAQLRTTRDGRLAADRLAASHQAWAICIKRAAFLYAQVNLTARALDRAIRTTLDSDPGRGL